jgi:hypothetical protein
MITTVDISDKDMKRVKELQKQNYSIQDIVIAGIILLEGCIAYAKEKEKE